MATMRQVLLRTGQTHTVVWVESSEMLKEGNFCTLKGDDREWEILNVFSVAMEKSEINRTWHVGGL